MVLKKLSDTHFFFFTQLTFCQFNHDTKQAKSLKKKLWKFIHCSKLLPFDAIFSF